MLRIFYITGNNYKFENAKKYAERLGINLIQKKLKIKEVQSDSIESIAKDKAEKAFNILKQPLIVSDSGWNIISLGGFPGPYMHYINKWFTSEDFLKLMKNRRNKSIIFKHIICAASSKGFKSFGNKIKGKLVSKPKGKGLPSDRIIQLGRCKYTIAECQNMKQEPVDDTALWGKIFKWLKTS